MNDFRLGVTTEYLVADRLVDKSYVSNRSNFGLLPKKFNTCRGWNLDYATYVWYVLKKVLNFANRGKLHPVSIKTLIIKRTRNIG